MSPLALTLNTSVPPPRSIVVKLANWSAVIVTVSPLTLPVSVSTPETEPVVKSTVVALVSTIASVPAPPVIVSAPEPEPPVIVSSPSPPVIVSAPEPPVSTLALASPVRLTATLEFDASTISKPEILPANRSIVAAPVTRKVSVPVPPAIETSEPSKVIVSLPSPPSIVSAPARPSIVSSAVPPVSALAPELPVRLTAALDIDASNFSKSVTFAVSPEAGPPGTGRSLRLRSPAKCRCPSRRQRKRPRRRSICSRCLQRRRSNRCRRRR